jgi:hypothetical protein
VTEALYHAAGAKDVKQFTANGVKRFTPFPRLFQA